MTLVTPSSLPGIYIIQPQVYQDDRGYFFESFNQKQFEKELGKVTFVQDNEAKSTRGILRGLHFQLPPFDQAKLVRCIKGTVLDISVDIRKGSPTFGQHIKIELSGENKKQVFISRGFAHGYITLSDEVIFVYKVDNYYSKNHDTGIFSIDPNLNIDWKISKNNILLSAKDKNLKLLKDIETPFTY